MAIDINSIQDYTDAEMLKAIRHAKVQIKLAGQSYTINGRTYTRADYESLVEDEMRLQARVDQATTGSVGLARLNRP
jgi:hypothetical protein